jgi:hypothetical protein
MSPDIVRADLTILIAVGIVTELLSFILSAGTKIQYPFIVNMLDHLFALKTGPHHTIYDRDQKSLHISYSVE